MTGYPLDPSPEEMRAMGQAAVDYVIDFIHGLPEAPARNVDGRAGGGARVEGVAAGGGRVVRGRLRPVP